MNHPCKSTENLTDGKTCMKTKYEKYITKKMSRKGVENKAKVAKINC